MPFHMHKDSYRFTLDHLKIDGRKINGILGYSSEGDQIVYSPFNMTEKLASTSEIQYLSMFLNLKDKNRNLLMHDFNLINIVSPAEQDEYMDMYINEKIDFENSFISYKNMSNSDNVLLLIYIFYQTRRFNKWSDETNGSFTILLKSDIQGYKFKLSDYVDRTLSNHPIKRIMTNLDYDNMHCGYLDIVGKNGERIENLPLPFLNDYRRKKILFDGIKIDFEKSFFISDPLENTLEYPISLTFIY